MRARISPIRYRLRSAAAMTLAAVGLAAAWPLPAEASVAQIGVTSSSSLRFGAASLARHPSLPITSNLSGGRVLYSVRLGPRRGGSSLAVRGLVQTAYCRSTNRKNNKPNNPCAGTAGYDFTPRISAKVVIADTPSATTGRMVQGWRGMHCRDEVAHCPLPVVADVSGVFTPGKYVNLVAAATNPGAGAGQVMAVEQKQGQLQVIQSFAGRVASRALVNGPRQPSFAASPGGSEAGKADERPAVIFSQPVTVKRGDVLDVRTSFRLTVNNSKDNSPFTGTSIYLTRSPAATYSETAIVRRAGENCPTNCSMTRVGAVRSPFSGVVHVNVVVLVKDHEGETNATVSYAGSLSVRKR